MPGFEGRESDRAASDHVITPCGDGSYCCGSGILASDCCKENRGIFVKNGTTVSRDASSVASDIVSLSLTKATPLPSSSAALTPTATAPSSSATKTSHQTGVILGAAIGGAAVLALMTGLIVLIGMRRNRNKSHNQETSPKILRDEIDQHHETYEASINNNTGELAIVGPAPELQDSEEVRKPVPELENFESHRWVPELQNFEFHRPVLELQSSTRSHRAKSDEERSQRSLKRLLD